MSLLFPPIPNSNEKPEFTNHGFLRGLAAYVGLSKLL